MGIFDRFLRKEQRRKINKAAWIDIQILSLYSTVLPRCICIGEEWKIIIIMRDDTKEKGLSNKNINAIMWTNLIHHYILHSSQRYRHLFPRVYNKKRK